MSSGQPMPEEIVAAMREAVEHAAGPEVVSAIRENHRRVHAMIEHMSEEEFANWIIGEE